MLQQKPSQTKRPGADSPFRGKNGFALIITLALLTFLILVLFSMTTLTRVETRMAGGSQQMNIARENAKMALNTAIGQLQRHVGPDMKITARADINPTNDQNPYWTGVWEDQSSNPTLLTWLVSGNEDPSAPTYFNPVPNLDRTVDDPYATPSPVPFLVPGTWPSSVNSVDFVRLVGSGSTGDNSAASSLPSLPDGDDPLHAMTTSDKYPGGVVAPKVPIVSREFPGLPTSLSADHVVGHYAYWVGDQGVKASVGLSEEHLKVDAYTANEDWRRLRQMIPQRMWFEGDTAAFTLLQNYPQFDLRSNSGTRDENEYLADVLNYSQVRHAFPTRNNFATGTSNRDQLKDRFHDITHMNYGVLANTAGSGLKVDLTWDGTQPHSDFLGVPSSQVTAVNPSLGTATVDLFAPNSLTAGAPALVIAPVVSELVTKYSVWEDPATNELRVRLEADVELWNPYTVDLDLSSADLLLRLDSLPAITVEHSYAPAPSQLDLAASDAHYIPLDSGQANVPATLAAGEVLHVTGYTSPDQPGSDGTATISFPTTDPTGMGAPAVITELSSAGATIEAELWLFPSGSAPTSGVDGVIDGLATAAVGRLIPDSFISFSVGPYPAGDDSQRFGYNLRLKDADDNAAWLTFYDPRNVGLQNGGSIDALESEPDPSLAFSAILDDPGTPQILTSNSASNRIRIFELPIREQVNMGALQHLYYHNEPAYALGNDWAGANVNLDFDRFFLSTIPSGAWTGDPAGGGGLWDFPVPNTRMVPYRTIDSAGVEYPSTGDLQTAQSAEHLMVKGAFNINSTSINAWRSVLGAMNIRRDTGSNFDPDNTTSGEWIYAASPSGIPLTSAVFRFSQTAHLMNLAYQDQAGIIASPAQAYMQGVRELTEDQVYALAHEIVDLLRNPPGGVQTPFLSLRDFVSSGILQLAIDNCDFSTLDPENPIPAPAAIINGTIPPYSPAFITQADLITGLAPFMAARSDTFVVRAYGDSYNPATGETQARAWCEAIVQRVPATLDPTDDPVNPAGKFGRKVEVVYFRWMTPDEL